MRGKSLILAMVLGLSAVAPSAWAQDDDDDSDAGSEDTALGDDGDDGASGDEAPEAPEGAEDAPTAPDTTKRVNEPAGEDDKWHLLDFMTFGIGIVGQAGANFLDKPGDQTVQGRNFPENADYPGFAGVTTGVGPMIEFRFLGYVGLELDILFQSDHGSADLDSTQRDGSGNIISQQTFTVDIGHSAVHLPLLIKGALPGKWVTPVVFLGPEFVVPGDATCEEGCTSNPSQTTYGAYSEGYTAFAFGLGLEINLPIPTADIRIPLSLRGNVNPGVKGTREERANHVVTGDRITTEDFSTAWKFQAVGNFGAAWHF
ncbi:MAG: hypothetical protein KC731_13645 [Myxococcales bacterium]|nr:hypothetical protein [Myxococcales bacterium]